MKPEEIKNLASLAKIEISDQEVADFQQDMQSILKYIDQINQATIDTVEPEFAQVNIARTDMAQEFLENSMVETAPDHQDGFYKVPKIL